MADWDDTQEVVMVPDTEEPAVRPRSRYRELPDPVRLEDTIAVHDPDAPPDPDGPGNPERDFMLRYAG